MEEARYDTVSTRSRARTPEVSDPESRERSRFMRCAICREALFRGPVRKEPLPPGTFWFWFLFQGNLEALGNCRGRRGLEIVVTQQFVHRIEGQARLLPVRLLLFGGLLFRLAMLEALLV